MVSLSLGYVIDGCRPRASNGANLEPIFFEPLSQIEVA